MRGSSAQARCLLRGVPERHLANSALQAPPRCLPSLPTRADASEVSGRPPNVRQGYVAHRHPLLRPQSTSSSTSSALVQWVWYISWGWLSASRARKVSGTAAVPLFAVSPSDTRPTAPPRHICVVASSSLGWDGSQAPSHRAPDRQHHPHLPLSLLQLLQLLPLQPSTTTSTWDSFGLSAEPYQVSSVIQWQVFHTPILLACKQSSTTTSPRWWCASTA